MLRATRMTKEVFLNKGFPSKNIRQLSSTPSFIPGPVLKSSDLNSYTLNAKYAVRGKIPTRAEELRHQLAKDPSSLPFKSIINVNIGNPQQLDQKPLTFYRQVLSLLQLPELITDPESSKTFPQDVRKRAEVLIKNIGSVGAYSHSQGIPHVRESVAKFITERDQAEAFADDIFLTAGASSGVSTLLSVLATGPSTGFLIPIPQYPLYTASIALNNATPISYFLKEENGWSTNPAEVRKSVEENKAKGIDVRALVIINPGNPTGAILSVDAIEEILSIAAEHGVVVIADEVYQENVFAGKFVSVKKVLKNLQAKYPGKFDTVQLASLHSTSKGVSGECGQRGGYMELVGFTPEVKAVLLKLASISLCPVVTGQALVELMINPPVEGEESYELYQKEKRSIHNTLKERASALYQAFKQMENVECQEPQGAMYLFPKLNLSKKAIQKAAELNMVADEFYCMQLLENTGICSVPGSGFGQVPGTYHLRTTFLAPGVEWISRWEQFHAKFMDTYRD